jgi:hypothetical protein
MPTLYHYEHTPSQLISERKELSELLVSFQFLIPILFMRLGCTCIIGYCEILSILAINSLFLSKLV